MKPVKIGTKACVKMGMCPNQAHLMSRCWSKIHSFYSQRTYDSVSFYQCKFACFHAGGFIVSHWVETACFPVISMVFCKSSLLAGGLSPFRDYIFGSLWWHDRYTGMGYPTGKMPVYLLSLLMTSTQMAKVWILQPFALRSDLWCWRQWNFCISSD